MASRSWFFSSQGQQQGPYPEVQLRQLIARGTVTAETLVWSEGMAEWQKAADIPGLVPGGSRPPAFPGLGGALTSAGGAGGGPITIEPGIWQLLGRTLLYGFGILFVVPAPWVATGFYRWMISCLHVPGRPNIAFTGQVGDIWYVFVAMALLIYAGLTGIPYIQYLAIPVDAYLSWMVMRWIAANFSSNGRQLPISFDGSALTYVGWYVLLYISAITIIGWAWVITAWMRWNCRNVSGTQREILFTASGLDVLWRTLVFVVASIFLIPIPWVLRWYTTWYVSQFELVERIP